MNTEIELPEIVESLRARIEVRGAHMLFADDALLAYRKRVASLPDARKRDVAIHTLALAVMLQRTRGDAADQAIAQCCQLAAIVLGSDEAARDLMSAHSDGIERAATLLGASPTKMPKRHEDARPELVVKARRGLARPTA